jgi:2-succinyl-6-hydroxy-2,4-cyclohexadiene-1-carboxylate synthase
VPDLLTPLDGPADVRIFRAGPPRPRGRPLVLLHGFTGHPEVWSELAAGWVARGRSVLAPALPGHDPGSPARRGESFAAAVTRLDDAIAGAVNPGPAVLVGYSMGARVGLGLLARRPAWIERAVLAGGRLPPDDPGDAEARRRQEEAWCEQLRAEGLAAFLEQWERLPLWWTQREVPAPRLERQRSLRSRHDPEGLARALETLGLAAMPRAVSALAAVDARVTLVVGARDEKFVPLTRELQSALPRASTESVPGAGHNVVLEAPAAFARLVEGDPR